jgi:hypothetical protein
MNRNPTGKGGFGDNPQNRNDRGLAKTPIFYINHYGVQTVEEILKAIKKPNSEKTVFENIALKSLSRAQYDQKERKDVMDRVDGTSVQRTEITGKDGSALEVSTGLTAEQEKAIRDKITEVVMEATK